MKYWLLTSAMVVLAFLALYDPNVEVRTEQVNGEERMIGVHRRQKMYEIRYVFPEQVYQENGSIKRLTLMVGGKRPPLQLHEDASPSEAALWRKLFQ